MSCIYGNVNGKLEMKKEYLDFSICLNCENCIKEYNTIKCKLNKLSIALAWESGIYYNYTMWNSEQSIIQNLDENCPNKIEHLVKCQKEKFQETKKGKFNSK